MSDVISANISQRKTGWVVNVTYDNGKRKQLSANSKKEAALRAAEAMAGTQQVKVPVLSQYTIKQAFEDAWEYQWKDASASKTHWLYGQQVLKFFGLNTPMEEVDAGSMLEFTKYLKEERGNAPATINHKYSSVRVMQEMAIVHGRVKNLPRLPKNLKLNNHRDRYWRDVEIRKVINYLEKIGRYDVIRYFLFLCEMGCRPVEMERNKASDYDLEKGTVTFFKKINDNKTGNRTLPLTPLALDVVKEQMPPMKTARMWPQEMTSMAFQLKKAVDHCDIEPIRVIKDTRHTCGTRLGRSGLSAIQIAAWLGNSPAMCERYVHLPHDQHAECYEALTKLRVAA